MEDLVVIVGAGPSGLAIAACLVVLSIPFILLEKEDCMASLWRRRAYDRLKLHLHKQFCQLPHMPHPPSTPAFIPKNDFIHYLDDYAAHFNINPLFCQKVEAATYNHTTNNWIVTACNTNTGKLQEYIGGFLVVATGENSEGFIPDIPGLESFSGDIIHSFGFKSGERYSGKRVLVVGSGNSGMEIAYDLSCFGATTSISIRSPLHVVSREMIYFGMVLLKYLPLCIVDALVLVLSKFKYGNLSKYGIERPEIGPFSLKVMTGRSPIIDVGTMDQIKKGHIQVFPAVRSVEGNEVIFCNGNSINFDTIVFATGYKSMINTWLKDDSQLFNKDGLPSKSFPNHWKGKNGIYCIGLSKRGLAGISMDAQLVAKDIHKVIRANRSL